MKVCMRTGVNEKTRQGCPYCANQKVWPGFNDLKSNFPEIASEAYGWDPSAVAKGSKRKFNWRCPKGHIYDMGVDARTVQGQNCPYCSNNRLLVGYNDLQTTHPDIALQADGWLPSTLVAGSNTKKDWICDLGHRWRTTPDERTRAGTNCPICANKIILKGFNDLETTDPLVAQQAHGWDPSKYARRSMKRQLWKCSIGHIWESTIANRTGSTGRNGRDCPICSNRILLTGFNDLRTKFPDIAGEADGWDPSNYLYGSAEMKNWMCSKGHKWEARISTRTFEKDGKIGTGCPTCASTGFSPEKQAWFYLLSRPGEQQLGITNNLEQRMRAHRPHGWIEIDKVGPCDGALVQDTEKQFKKWLRKNIGGVPGTSENWYTAKLEVRSLRELKSFAGIKTGLF